MITASNNFFIYLYCNKTDFIQTYPSRGRRTEKWKNREVEEESCCQLCTAASSHVKVSVCAAPIPHSYPHLITVASLLLSLLCLYVSHQPPSPLLFLNHSATLHWLQQTPLSYYLTHTAHTQTHMHLYRKAYRDSEYKKYTVYMQRPHMHSSSVCAHAHR